MSEQQQQLKVVPLMKAAHALHVAVPDLIMLCALVDLRMQGLRTRTVDLVAYTGLTFAAVHGSLRKMHGWRWVEKRRLGEAMQDGTAWRLAKRGKASLNLMMERGRAGV